MYSENYESQSLQIEILEELPHSQNMYEGCQGGSDLCIDDQNTETNDDVQTTIESDCKFQTFQSVKKFGPQLVHLDGKKFKTHFTNST